ncbi:N-acetyltransferase [Sandaracinomonas limnophila]|uniref:N-acetyltransferase n=1 Tax=Sandaracinomonas limnophila TaxID=1862386 RepID=A0A437PR77_9BACT|nr:GNAT family N-acetyltransferase [Sandaracinomonas limnophila]RVU24746.1 N-acetyltransferase [Sandaracinomonas limnophila]
MISLQTDRLKLIPLDHSMLKIWSKEGRSSLEKALQLNSNPFDLEKFYEEEMQEALVNFWLPQTHKYPLDFCWYTNWEIILKDKSCSIGGIGFSGLPNNDGFTEIGYVIDQKFRNLGYANEAIEAIIDWANQDVDLKGIIAETPQNNLASQKVLQKNGFLKTGEKSIFIKESIPLFTWQLDIKK